MFRKAVKTFADKGGLMGKAYSEMVGGSDIQFAYNFKSLKFLVRAGKIIQ